MSRRKPQAGNPQIIIGYVRVSTDEQSLGPVAQRKALERYCHANGAELVAVYEDLAVSGAAPLDKRPGLLAALDDVAAHGAGVLLVAKRDRLARDVVVCAMVERLAERSGARILTADGTGNGEGPEQMLMRGIVDLFAQYERAVIRSRTKAAMAVKQARGERVGNLPFGSGLGADGVHLIESPAELAALAVIREQRAQGQSIRDIAKHLDASGIPSRGERWHKTLVGRLVQRLDRA